MTALDLFHAYNVLALARKQLEMERRPARGDVQRRDELEAAELRCRAALAEAADVSEDDIRDRGLFWLEARIRAS